MYRTVLHKIRLATDLMQRECSYETIKTIQCASEVGEVVASLRRPNLGKQNLMYGLKGHKDGKM